MRRRRRGRRGRRAPSGAAISMPFDAEPRLKRRLHLPVGGPAEDRRGRAERQRGGFGRRDSRRGRAAGHVAEHGLQLLLRGLQLAGELRVQVALPIDVAHELEARLRGALRRRLRPFRRRFAGVARSALALARAPSRVALQLGERLLMRGDAIAIELGQRGDGPRRLTEVPQVGGREEQPQIPRLAELVDFDEPRAQLRLGCALGRLQRRPSARRSPPARPRPSRRRRPAASSLPIEAGVRSPASATRRAASVPAGRGDRLRAGVPATARSRAARAPRSRARSGCWATATATTKTETAEIAEIAEKSLLCGLRAL